MKLRTLIRTIALKREKREVLKLPPKEEVVVQVTLSPAEQEAYTAIYGKQIQGLYYVYYVIYFDCSDTYLVSLYLVIVAVRDYVADLAGEGGDDRLMTNSATVLAYITRMRQCCLDLSLVPVASLVKLLSKYKDKTSNNSIGGGDVTRLSERDQAELLKSFEDLFNVAKGSATGTDMTVGTDIFSNIDLGLDVDVDADAMLECAICMDGLTEDAAMIFRVCKHTFCEVCITQLFRTAHSGCIACPFCRQEVTKSKMVDECCMLYVLIVYCVCITVLITI